MFRNTSHILVLFFTAFVWISCGTSMNIQTDYDQQAKFNHLESYGWIEMPDRYNDRGALGFDSGIMARRIKNMVHRELDSLGYIRKEEIVREGTELPDFQISYRMLATEEVEVVRDTYPVGYHSPHHGRHGGHRGLGSYGGYGSHDSDGHTREFVQCVLMLDIWDPKTNRLVWRGWARWRMGEQPNPKEVSTQLERAVEEILKKFPPMRQKEV